MPKAKKDKKVVYDARSFIHPVIDSKTGAVSFTDDEGNTVSPSDFEGNEVLPAYRTGIGVDVHKSFFAISLIVGIGSTFREFHWECETTDEDILAARDFAIALIESQSDPHIDVNPDELRYTCESTGNYHQVLLKLWKGKPSVVNPVLANAGRRKSDRIDARGLAQASLQGYWAESFLFSDDVKVLRTLSLERERCSARAVNIGNHINSELLRYGITLGREGSVTRKREVRNQVENILMSTGRDYKIPDTVRMILKEEYRKWDEVNAEEDKYQDMIFEQIYGMNWKFGDKEINGIKAIELLQTVPGVGELTAVVWLSNIVDASRFPTYLKCSAYCGFDPSNKVSAGNVTSNKKRKGNKALHTAITRSASVLMGKHSEPFGRWGYQIYERSGKWKKAAHALGRKIAIALYYVQLSGEPFDYSRYQTEEPEVIDLPLADLVNYDKRFKRYLGRLYDLGITTTQEMVHAYYICRFKREKGFGKNFYYLVRQFIDNQDVYAAYMNEGGHQDEKKENN